MAPVIFIVPGLWEGPKVFEPLKKRLEASGLTVHVCALVSTGTTAAEGLTVDDDRAAIARDLAGVVEWAGQDGVVVFLHSAGGFLCCDAMKGLTANEFNAMNKEGGGVRRIIFMSCALGVEGFETMPTSTMKFSVCFSHTICCFGTTTIIVKLLYGHIAGWLLHTH
jgi:alpha-beta hydrolase superfamily lysophospholipase